MPVWVKEGIRRISNLETKKKAVRLERLEGGRRTFVDVRKVGAETGDGFEYGLSRR